MNLIRTLRSIRQPSGHHHRITPSWLRRYFYRLLLVAVIGICLFTGLYWRAVNDYAAGRRCFGASSTARDDTDDAHNTFTATVTRLPDIMVDRRQPTPGRSVFFHETSCARNGVAHLNARQACAIESAALTSPEWDVFVLFASPSGLANNSNSSSSSSSNSGQPLPPLFEALLTYGNVFMRNVNLWTYAEDTPLAAWMRTEVLFESRYLNSHASDLLRYLSLYKWGGTYLDLDVVLMRNLSTIPPNYAGAESAQFVAAGVINFDHRGAGHAMAEQCLLEFRRTFDGSDWGNNGPGVITRVLHEVCSTTYPALMTRSRCKGFEVFDVERFYAVRWPDWKLFFDEERADDAMELTKNSYAVHVWNKHSHAERVRVGSGQAYGVLAAKYCPRVYAAAGTYF